MPISNTVIQSLIQQNTSQRIQFTGRTSAVLIILQSLPGFTQQLANGGSFFPSSRFTVTPLIKIAGQVTSINSYEQTIKTVRGVVDLEPIINSFGIDNLWGVDVFADGNVYDVLMYGYLPPE